MLQDVIPIIYQPEVSMRCWRLSAHYPSCEEWIFNLEGICLYYISFLYQAIDGTICGAGAHRWCCIGCTCIMERNCLSRPFSMALTSWNSSNTTIMRCSGVDTFSTKDNASSNATDEFCVGMNDTSMASETGFMDMVGKMRKCAIICLTFSSG